MLPWNTNWRLVEHYNRQRFDILTAVTMKNAVLWDTEIQFVPHRRHITSPLHRLILCNIWGFRGGDNEECRLLGYRYPNGTSQEILLLRYRVQPDNVMKHWRFSRRWLRGMRSSGMLRRVALVWTDVSEKPSVCIIRVTRIDELGITLANWSTLYRNTFSVFSEILCYIY
jgi:hypothetical protein